MELYIEYRKEKDGAETLHCDDGFIVYQIVGDRCHICELYVRKEQRRNGLAKRMAQIVFRRAQETGCRTITCTVCTRNEMGIRNLEQVLRQGFLETFRLGEEIYLTKEI